MVKDNHIWRDEGAEYPNDQSSGITIYTLGGLHLPQLSDERLDFVLIERLLLWLLEIRALSMFLIFHCSLYSTVLIGCNNR